MLGPLGHAIAREFIALVRDPGSRRILLAAPVFQLVVFSYAATMEIHNAEVGVINADGGRWSRELLQRLEAASFVESLIPVASTAQLDELIERRQILLAVHFPADFSRRIEAGQPGQLQMIVDGRRANAGQVAFSYIRTIAADLQMELAETRTDIRPPPQVVVRHRFNPNLQYRRFILPAMVATLAMLPTMLVSSLSIARDRELGTFEQLLVSPLTSLQIILGKLLPAVFSGLFSSLLILSLVVFAFQVPLTGNLLLLLSSLVVFVFAVAGVGLAVSACCYTQQQALLGMFALVVPMMLTSGFLTPVDNMPDYMRNLAQMNPLKHILVIVLGSFLKSMSATEILANLWPMLVISLVTLGGAVLIVRHRVG